MHIALEGIDGSGTTTQLPRLAQLLRDAGYEVVCCAEPTGGPIGAMARQFLGGSTPTDEATLALLFAADRLAHTRQLVEPNLRAGRLVLSDRALLSSYAYQGCALPLAWVQQINAPSRPPDLSILLQVTSQTAALRRAQRGAAPQQFDGLARQVQVAEQYEVAFNLPNVGTTLRVDGEPCIASVTVSLQAALAPHLSRLTHG
jgi:dTMP kinase